MAGTFNTGSIRHGIELIAAEITARADELNRLDGALGDGDLGITMARGVQGLREAAPELPDNDVGAALLRCAQVFTKVSGSTYGTLLATGLMAAAKATRGQAEAPWSEVSGLLGTALDAMMKRGRGALGDKTVLDAIEAARAATAGLDEPHALAVAADEGVAKTLDDFRGQQAKQGRARIFGDKSVGLDDPGMVAFKLVMEALR
jgi:dihydroxyacetone kinase-like protein